MNIKFIPKDKDGKPETYPSDKWPEGKSILTNVGEYRPGQVLSMMPHQIKEAKRLIENGDFEEVADAPAFEEKGTPAPEVQEELEADLGDVLPSQNGAATSPNEADPPAEPTADPKPKAKK